MIHPAVLIFMLADAMGKGSPARDIPLPPSLETLGAISKAVLGNPRSDAPWRLSRGSWATVWSAEAFGIGKQAEDSSRFRFRVPPDADRPSLDGKEPLVVESYQNGLPLFGTAGSGTARPLGFRYGKDGYCVNVSIQVFKDARWRPVRLSRREATIMGRFLAANEYAAGEAQPPPARFGTPWIRIVVEGCGDYWIDQDLDCVGPFGAGGRLLPEIKSNIQDLINGGYAKLKPHKEP